MASANTPTFKDKLAKAFPGFSRMFKASKPLIRQFLATGGAAGDITVTGIYAADEIVSVFNVTDWTDLTSEFKIAADGTINNTGGTATTSKKLLVTWHPWTIV